MDTSRDPDRLSECEGTVVDKTSRNFLLLSKYDDSFKWTPIKSMIKTHQKRYYDAIMISNESTDCTAFVEFMTGIIVKTLIGSTEVIDRGEIYIDEWIPPMSWHPIL